MATLITDPSGLRRIQVQVRRNYRPTIRLGRMELRKAQTVLMRIEALVAGRTTGAIDPETARWLNGLDDTMHERIARTGLAPSRDRDRLREGVDRGRIRRRRIRRTGGANSSAACSRSESHRAANRPTSL